MPRSFCRRAVGRADPVDTGCGAGAKRLYSEEDRRSGYVSSGTLPCSGRLPTIVGGGRLCRFAHCPCGYSGLEPESVDREPTRTGPLAAGTGDEPLLWADSDLRSSIGAKTVSEAQLLKPYPRFQNIATYRNNSGTTNYNAIETKVEQRFSHGGYLFCSPTRIRS